MQYVRKHNTLLDNKRHIFYVCWMVVVSHLMAFCSILKGRPKLTSRLGNENCYQPYFDTLLARKLE